MDLLAGLNDAQRLAVLHNSGPLAVLAGPGTGKTKLIVHRLAHMIVELDIDPNSIAALTFTVKAAGEMRERLAKLLALCGPQWAGKAAMVRAHTYHGLGRVITWRFADRLKLPASLRLVDEATLRRLAREVIVQNNLMGLTMGQGADAAAAAVLQQAAAMSNAAITTDHARAYFKRTLAAAQHLDSPEAAGARAHCALFAQSTDAVAAVRAEQKRRGWIGYDELITLPIELLRADPLARDILRAELRHAVVDEFQDVNTSTIVLLSELFPPSPSSPPDLCVVGDDDQAIYGFRGADERAFARFAEIWPAPRTITLQENYRSAAPILGAAARTISHATGRASSDKVLIPALARPADKPGSAVQIVHTKDDAEIGEVIAATLIRARAAAPELPWSKYAVLSRTHGELDRVQAALELEGIPVRRRKRIGTMADEGVQDLKAWCQILIDPTDSPTARRLLQRAPISLPAAEVIALEPTYCKLARARRLDGTLSPLPPYAHWLSEQRPDDPRLSRFREVFDLFHPRASTTRADALVYDLAIETGVVHADLLAPAQRALRLESVVQFIQFAQERQPTLGKPGDITQLLDLLTDFDEDDELGVSTADRVDKPSEAADTTDQADDGVVLLTAHASKGLEFDTVILPRVNPQHGYPKTSGGRDREPLPQGLLQAPPEADNATPPRLREERRIFYVACTRAERRLILVGKKPPKKTDAVYYTSELLASPTAAPEPEPSEALLSATPMNMGELRRQLTSAKAVQSRRTQMAELAASARADAAAALASVEHAATTAAQFELATAALRAAAERLAVIATVGRAQTAPAWAGAAAVASITARLGPTPTPAPSASILAMSPATAPLRLSFTKIDAYTRCPACYYCKYVLGLDEPSSAEINTGEIVHAAMERYGKLCQHADAEGHPRPALPALHKIGRDVLTAADAAELSVASESELLARLTAQLTSAHTLMQRRPSNILLIEQKVVVPFLHKGAHEITAKLDRVDQLPDNTYAIIDYKSGQPWKKLLEPPPEDLQLGIYAMALQHHFEADEILPGIAEYQLLATAQSGRIDAADLDLAAVREQINTVIDGLLAGLYPRKDNCEGPCRILHN